MSNSLLTSIGIDSSKWQKGLADAATATNKSVGEIKKILRLLQNESLVGKSEQQIRDLNKLIGQLTDDMGDLKAVQKGLGTEFASLTAQGLQGFVALGEVVTGVASVFGLSKEAGEKFQQTMVQLIGVSQAFATIQGIIEAKTYQTIAARIKETIVVKAVDVAMKSSIVTAGLMTGGIGLLFTAVILLTKAFSSHSKELDTTTEAYQNLLKVQKDMTAQVLDIRAENQDMANKHLVSVGKMTEKEYELAKVQLEKESRIRKANEDEEKAKKLAQENYKDSKNRGYDYLKLQQDLALATASKNAIIVEAEENARQKIIAVNDKLREQKKETKLNTEAYKAYLKESAKYIEQQEIIADIEESRRNILSGLDDEISSVIKNMTEIKPTYSIPLPVLPDEENVDDGIDTEKVVKDLEVFNDKMNLLNDQFKNTFMDMGTTVSEGIAGLITNDIDTKDFGKQILGVFGNFLSSIGKAILSFGVAMTAFQQALKNIFSPIGAIGTIAAGLGLITAGAVVKNLAEKGVQKFAEGGIVGGNSFSGDRIMARVNSGEMILNGNQQSNLFKMINVGGSGGGELTTRVSGSDLIFVMNNANRKRNAIR